MTQIYPNINQKMIVVFVPTKIEQQFVAVHSIVKTNGHQLDNKSKYPTEGTKISRK